ncbi:hypothetical protein CLSA_c23350 [Clostridium saccharobutylicum DSM 13864]|uniref:Uncharacterized protein n=1 Tax=Clostridium saccharobutylicum DSM 13864 TaxID=1345695 RepID=U5MR72_CLOSA|nr:hypothetical protein CLSA_c23350 [Clostridium saccharobutylicum DSM 13864]
MHCSIIHNKLSKILLNLCAAANKEVLFMNRGTSGFLGGWIAGFVKLVIDQIAVAINISSHTLFLEL